MKQLSRKVKDNYPQAGTGARQGARLARQAARGLISLTTPAELRRIAARQAGVRRVRFA